VLLIAVGLFADLLWGRWAQAAVTGLVVDLGDPAATIARRSRVVGGRQAGNGISAIITA
jgi:hypothetical protein